MGSAATEAPLSRSPASTGASASPTLSPHVNATMSHSARARQRQIRTARCAAAGPRPPAGRVAIARSILDMHTSFCAPGGCSVPLHAFDRNAVVAEYLFRRPDPYPRQIRHIVALRAIRENTEGCGMARNRSEEHTSELQSLMRISYAVFCLKKKNTERQKLYDY